MPSRSLRWPALFFLVQLVFNSSVARAQGFVPLGGQYLFLNGANVAWVNFARDVGPEATDFETFQAIFDSVHAYGGNSMRLWLHANGVSSPEFNAQGDVVGPGANTIADLQTLLDLAWEREIGLILCLWSFDMLRISNGSTLTDRAMRLLTDTTALRAYLENALVPMVDSLRSHPGIIAWEIFNEPEGMSIEYGWDFTRHVPMAMIQRFVNWAAGTIHRVAPEARVTSGAWSFMSLSDLSFLSEQWQHDSTVQKMSADARRRMEQAFELHYRTSTSVERILARSMRSLNSNYYRDDRLISAGGDPLGTLDFYSVHYYPWGGTALSPFHHHCASWQLTKPTIVAEFSLDDTFGVPYRQLYPQLLLFGYAGALSWSWTDQDVYVVQQARTKEAMWDLLIRYPDFIDVAPVSGQIYAFTVTPAMIEIGEAVHLFWSTSPGSTTFLDDRLVHNQGDSTVYPTSDTSFCLKTLGAMPDSMVQHIRVIQATDVSLSANYPNPCRGPTSILVTSPEALNARVYIVGMLGQVIATLHNGTLEAGVKSFVWDGAVASGVYFCRLESSFLMDPSRRVSRTQKVVVVH